MNTDLDSTFNLSNTNNQTIQITNPYTSTQQNSKGGYGKWVDNSQNLVIVECYINSTLKQSIHLVDLILLMLVLEFPLKVILIATYLIILIHPKVIFIHLQMGFRIKGVVNLNNITSVLTNIGTVKMINILLNINTLTY